MANICESLKDIVGKCAVDQSHAIKIKVRRNYVFSDFCERIEKPWIQNKLGCSFSIEFYGESVIDQGGLSRAFFSGKEICHLL